MAQGILFVHPVHRLQVPKGADGGRLSCPCSNKQRFAVPKRHRVAMEQKRRSVANENQNDGRATASLFGLKVRTNGDVLKFGIIAIAIAYGFKTMLTLLGVRDLLAGQITTGVVSVASLLAWTST